MTTKYRIDFVTIRSDGTGTVSSLFSTDRPGYARRIRHRVEKALELEPKTRTSRPVVVTGVDLPRLQRFVQNAPSIAQKIAKLPVFPSIVHLAMFIECQPASLRIAISKAHRAGKEAATARGVTFKYA